MYEDGNLGVVDAHDQVREGVAVDIGDREALRVARYDQSARVRRDWRKATLTVSLQEEAHASGHPPGLRLCGKEILRQKDVHCAVEVQVRDDYAKSRRNLRKPRQGRKRKAPASVV